MSGGAPWKREEGERFSPNGSPALMRAINAEQVIRKLRARGPLSRADLARATGLSKPTITKVVEHLEELGYVAAVNEPDREGMAFVARYEYRASRGQVLGVDVGADKSLLLLADLDGNILGSSRFATRSAAPGGPPQVFEQLKAAADDLLATAGASRGSLLSVVLGTPGVVSPAGVVTMAPQLEGWEGLDLRSALQDLFDCPVSVEGELSLSLQAEGWRGVAKGLDDALFVHLGVGVGAALLVGGKIHRGADGGAGEIGQMPYPIRRPDGRTDFVPLESLAGGGALQRRGRELAVRAGASRLLDLVGGDVNRIDASTVFRASREGDAASRSLLDEATEVLAWGISTVICALNPPAVIVGGGLSRGADLFLPQLQRHTSSLVPFPPAWFVSQLGDEAVALGAVKQATAMTEQDLFESLGRRAS